MAWFNWFNSRKLPAQPEVRIVPPEMVEVWLEDRDLIVPESEIGVVLDQNDTVEEFPLNSDILDLLTGGWIHVVSSNVEAIKYNLDDNTMDVEFQHGRYYRYMDVEPGFFVKFYRAHSPGGFVWEEIRRPNRYRFVRYGGQGSRPTQGSSLQPG